MGKKGTGMKKLKTILVIVCALLAVSVACNILLLTGVLPTRATPEWLAAEVSEEEAAAGGYKAEYMQMALDLAKENVVSGNGGPIGVVIVKDGEVVVATTNEMRQNHNSYDHGEMAAIREAEQKLGKMYLTGCELYTTAQPCVMCEAAIYWAKISKVYYAASIQETSKYDGFDDLSEYEAMYAGKNLVESVDVRVDNELEALDIWQEQRTK